MNPTLTSLCACFGVLVFLSLACQSIDPPVDPVEMAEPTDTDIVTGIVLVDALAQPIESYGNPNERVLSLDSTGTVRAYPIPAKEALSFPIELDNPVEVWFVPAEQNLDFAGTDFTELLADFAYPQADLKTAAALIEITAANSGPISIDVSALEAGFYRMFVYEEAQDQLSWQNIYIEGNDQSPAEITALFEAWE
ncbi:MAG: hypothetical protein AAF399_09830 [Bacteroidota bacterium]